MTESEQQAQQQTWSVYAPTKTKEEICEKLDKLNDLIVKESGVEISIPRAKLILLALQNAIEIREPSGYKIGKMK